LPLAFSCLAAAAAAFGACDAGHQDDQVVAGPAVHLVAANVGGDAGAAFPSDGVIRLTFDRNLLPSTVTRQSVIVQDDSPSMNTYTSIISYDPVARVISLSNPSGGEGGTCWLTPNTYFSVILPTPTSSNPGGLRAIDTATLDMTYTVGFRTPANPCPELTPVVTPVANFCTDVYPIFQNLCSAPQCHGSPQTVQKSPLFPAGGMSAPAAGLILDEPIGVLDTAIGKPANGANTGPNSVYESPSAKFGVNMPIIDPSGDPANSWLMYKLLLAIPPAIDNSSLLETCPGVSTLRPFDAGPSAQPMSVDERKILANYVPGREMPYPAYPGMGDPVPPDAQNGGSPALSFNELERVRAWLVNPQVPASCSASCGLETDAGPDSGADTGADTGSADSGEADAKADAGTDASADGASDGATEASTDATLHDAKGD
jgi:hypothetical protein